jgi:hypothetical protein
MPPARATTTAPLRVDQSGMQQQAESHRHACQG